jgi:chaperone modulatory protein CbpM
MDTKDFISIQQFCKHYNIPESFIGSLHDYELIEIRTTDKTQFVSVTQIKNIEKLIRFHYELDINLEGMHAISNLLNKVEELQDQIKKLNNKLNFYEDS